MDYETFGVLKAHSKQRVAYSNSQILEFFEKNQIAIKSSYDFVLRYRQNIISPPKMSVFFYIFSKLNLSNAEDFVRKFSTGLDLSSDSPIYLLREKLIADSNAKTKLSPEKKYALVMGTWNLYRKNKKVVRLQIPESFPRAI